jgi:hypothetical protein
MFTIEHKTSRKHICAELLQRSNEDGDETLVSSSRPNDKKTISGMASSVVDTQENIQGADFCW